MRLVFQDISPPSVSPNLAYKFHPWTDAKAFSPTTFSRQTKSVELGYAQDQSHLKALKVAFFPHFLKLFLYHSFENISKCFAGTYKLKICLRPNTTTNVKFLWMFQLLLFSREKCTSNQETLYYFHHQKWSLSSLNSSCKWLIIPL